MIGRRVSTRVGVALFVTLLVFAVLQGVLFRAFVRNEVELVRAHAVEEAVALARLVARAPELDAAVLGDALGEGLVLAVYDADGRRLVLAGSIPGDYALPEALDPSVREAVRAAGGRGHHLLPFGADAPVAVVASVPGGRYVALLELETGERIAALRRHGQLIVFGLTVLVAFVMTLVFARRIRRRVRAAEATVRTMAAGDLGARLPPDEDDELGALARDFNVMADRMEHLVRSLREEEARQRALFASFTHELGTPLTSVLGYLEALSMPEVDADEATRRKYVAVAYDRARQLDALADDLTTLSRLDWEGLPLDRGPHDLAALAAREVEALTPAATERSLALRVRGEAVIASVDPLRMAQVLRNLLTNAVRHAEAGTDVEVVLASRADGARIEVRNRGEGIAPEHLARLGEPLYRPDASRDRATGGRGLGLAISRGIVHAHGGTLEIRSDVGVGTTVVIELPTEPTTRSR